MNSRERVLCALNHVQPDRCPVDFWAEETMKKTLLRHYGFTEEQQLIEYFETDIQFVFPDSLKRPDRVLPDGSWIDASGARKRMVKNRFCEYAETLEYPLAYAETAEDLDRYDLWPDAEAYDWAHFSDKIGDLHEKRIIKLHTGGLFEMAWGLRGQEQYLTDLLLDPEIPHRIMSKLCDYWCAYVHRAMEAAGDKIDVVYTYDDIAAQNALIMSPEMLQEFVYPYHRKLNAVIKSYGKKILYHSCGAVVPEIANLKDLPIDILNPIQPRAAGMDLEKIKNTYGNELCFHGGIDIQQTLPYGTPDEVREAVRHAVKILGRDGGYIMASAHYIQNDTPIENIEAMYDPAIR